MGTLESSRNSADPEVTTEPNQEDRCLRPLQRARDRRAARLQQESDARAVTNFDPHDSSSGRSSASCTLKRPQTSVFIGWLGRDLRVRRVPRGPERGQRVGGVGGVALLLLLLLLLLLPPLLHLTVAPLREYDFRVLGREVLRAGGE